MCRSIKTLRGQEPPPTEEEFQAAARQFIRKVSGFREPSRVNREVYEKAIAEIAEISKGLLDDLVVRS